MALHDDAVRSAFDATPRRWFVPPDSVESAALDAPVQIGHGQTNSQPRTVDDMLRLLDVHRGHRILDVGAGSGWTTALLAHLTGPDGEVVGTEIVPELVDMGRQNLARMNRPWARIEPADPDRLGWPDEAPYDRILVSAEARKLPQALVDQLTDDGRMVIPVFSTMLLVRRIGQETKVSEHGAYRFVPLR